MSAESNKLIQMHAIIDKWIHVLFGFYLFEIISGLTNKWRLDIFIYSETISLADIVGILRIWRGVWNASF